MSKTVQFKRGNANVSATYVGAQGEITVNTDNYTLNVHDGVTAGGYSILNTNVSNIGNLVVTNQTITGTLSNTDITLSPTNANVVLTSNLVTPNIKIENYTISSLQSGSSLSLPSSADGANVNLINNTGNINLSVIDPTTSNPHTITLDTSSYLTLPGYIKSTLGAGEIQFGGTQGLLMYADFSTGSTGISLNEVGQTQIFANSNIAIITDYDDTTRSWVFDTTGNLTFPDGSVQSTAYDLISSNLSLTYIEANTQSVIQTLSNADMRLTATDGIRSSSIYLWANNQRMSFNTVSNAFDFNFNGQLSATDFTASKNSDYGYSFYAAGGGYSGMRHRSGPPDYIAINHEDIEFTRFYANYTVDIYGNLVISSDGNTFGSFPDAYVQVYSNVDSYSQFVLQNLNDGSTASTDMVITADNGDDSSYYLNLGIDGSNYADPSWFGDSSSSNDGYLVVVGYDATGPSTGNVGNLILGSTNGIIKTFVGNIAEANVITTTDQFGLSVRGNLDVNNEINAGNYVYFRGGTVIGDETDGNIFRIIAPLGYGAVIETDADIEGNNWQWTFNVDGTLDTPGSINVTGNVSTGNLTVDGTTELGNIIINFSAIGLVPGSAATEINIIPDPEGWAFLQLPNNSTANVANTRLVNAAGNVFIETGDLSTGNSNSYSWTFDNTGNLTTPGNLAVGTAGNLNAMTVKTEFGTIKIGNGGDGTFEVTDPNFTASMYVAGPDFVITTNGNASPQSFTFGYQNSANVIFPGNLSLGDGLDSEIVNPGNNIIITANTASWVFDTDGNLALPHGGTLLVSGGITAGPIIASPAPSISGFGTATFSGNVTAANINANVNGYSIGYRDVPQVVFNSNVTLALTDAGKHYYSANSANVITIPNNATVSFNIGTAISIVQEGTANLTISPDSGVTLYLAGNSTSTSRTLGNYGMATLMKVASNTWFINGTGVN